MRLYKLLIYGAVDVGRIRGIGKNAKKNTQMFFCMGVFAKKVIVIIKFIRLLW
jgi:hypothetical protein